MSELRQIIVDGLEFEAFHGVYAYETQIGTQFIVDAVLDVEGLNGFCDDLIASTLDYDDVIMEILEISTRRRYHLIEKLAESIARAMLDKVCVVKADIRVTKVLHTGAQHKVRKVAVRVVSEKEKPHA